MAVTCFGPGTCVVHGTSTRVAGTCLRTVLYTCSIKWYLFEDGTSRLVAVTCSCTVLLREWPVLVWRRYFQATGGRVAFHMRTDVRGSIVCPTKASLQKPSWERQINSCNYMISCANRSGSIHCIHYSLYAPSPDHHPPLPTS